MNHLILKYATPITVVILAIFGYVIGRRIADGGVSAITVLATTAVCVWVVASFALILMWPRITVGGFKRVLTRRGLGGGPVPVNTLYATPGSPSASASSGTVMSTGTDDLLYLGGWLDLKAGPRVLHVPEWTAATSACSSLTRPAVPTSPMSAPARRGPGRATSSSAPPGWSGGAPDGMTRIEVPHGAALLVGRVFLADEADRETAYALAKQIQLAAPSARR